jgi:hypothetical protein
MKAWTNENYQRPHLSGDKCSEHRRLDHSGAYALMSMWNHAKVRPASHVLAVTKRPPYICAWSQCNALHHDDNKKVWRIFRVYLTDVWSSSNPSKSQTNIVFSICWRLCVRRSLRHFVGFWNTNLKSPPDITHTPIRKGLHLKNTHKLYKSYCIISKHSK